MNKKRRRYIEDFKGEARKQFLIQFSQVTSVRSCLCQTILILVGTSLKKLQPLWSPSTTSRAME